MIANAIQSLLKYHNRVNIPALGAIIKQQDFSQSIFFNQFIRYDDGILVNHLIRVESLSQDEAQGVIDGFINKLFKSISHEGKFVLDGLGIFCMIDNRLELLEEKDYQHHLLMAAEQANPAEEQAGLMSEDVSPATPETMLSPEEEIATTPASSSLQSDAYSVLDSTDQWEESSAGFEGNPKVEPTRSANSDWRKTVLITLALMVPAGVAFYFIYGHSPIQHAAASVSPVASQLEATPLSDTSPQTTSSLNATPKVSLPYQYHIIIGSFVNESNADRLVSEQSRRGNDVVKLGKQNGFYLVSYQGIADVDIAKLKCEEVRKAFPEAWLVRW